MDLDAKIVNLDAKIVNCDIVNKTCNICDAGKTTIRCPYCSYTTCVTCTKKYILTTVYQAHCMSCRTTWSEQFIEQSFSKHFLQTEYRDKTENILWEREKSYLPSTQAMVMYTIQLEQLDKEITLLHDEIKQIQDKITQRRKAKQDIQQQQISQLAKPSIVPCPLSSCQGIITDHICQLCHSRICDMCNEKQEDQHCCRPEQLLSIQLIKETSKSCPKCSVSIFRSSGCDHMWCTSCHTPFRWSTLEIEKAVVPNPHYYEYMAKTATIICHESVLIDQRHKVIVEQRIEALDVTDHVKSKLHKRLATLIYMREVELPILPTENEYMNQDLRIKLLRNEITEKQCKSLVYIRNRKSYTQQKHRDLLSTYVSIISDWFLHLTIETNFIEQEEQLRHYINKEIDTLNTYHQTKYKIVL